MEASLAVLVVIAAVGAIVCGFIAAAIASSRGLAPGGYFAAGLFLGVIGIIIAAVAQRPVATPSPPGWYPDPWGQSYYRWYDGCQWTYHLDSDRDAPMAQARPRAAWTAPPSVRLVK